MLTHVTGVYVYRGNINVEWLVLFTFKKIYNGFLYTEVFCESMTPNAIEPRLILHVSARHKQY